MVRNLLSICFALIFSSTFAQDITGKWKTIDDETGKVKSIVEIYLQDGKAHGKILEIFRAPEEDQNPNCRKCTDDRKNKPVIGMEIIRGLENDDEEWEDGTILDPENGKVYDCKLWVDEDDPNILNVRGYVAFFFRTQTWERVTN
ncbi:DUF2147 domain-containing protein [Luteibaculum oceani]|uniref:DUF2147 domain-containing protein n=1 Tax=Luteibaculum oceani TaxID=1294296 RepID=A0A5C6V861_9FLAO|nr:DUF2147 domain-containing protein [Luteibaculum oceani]TXC81522.1 DUF2147 domain-containing protein [Luteibaculum oceani]